MYTFFLLKNYLKTNLSTLIYLNREEVEIENGVPKWQKRPNSRVEGVEIDKRKNLFSNPSSAFHRPNRSTVGDFSQLYKSSSTSEGSFNSTFQFRDKIK